MTILKLVAASLAACSLAGCATVLRGTNETFEINSDPEGATASLSNGESCVTPCELHLKRREPFVVEFMLEGYETLVAEVQSEFNGGAAVAGNFLIGGIIGAGVDASNGSLNNLVPNPLNVTLTPLSAKSEVSGETSLETAAETIDPEESEDLGAPPMLDIPPVETSDEQPPE